MFFRIVRSWFAFPLLVSSLSLPALAQTPGQTPELGAKALDFSLNTPEGQPVELASLLKQGDVALVFLRGFPGYQCPLCQRQVHGFEANAGQFAAKGVQLLLVYPGKAKKLDHHAQQFLKSHDALPANFHLVIDPDFTVVNQYGLRWDAPFETAHPSSFLLDRNGTVLYRKISHTHGDRAKTDDILGGLPAQAQSKSPS